MKKNTLDKLSAAILGATSAFLLLGGSTEAFAANLTASPQNEITGTEVGSLVTFNLNNLEATQPNEKIAFTAAEEQSNSGMKKWIASIYYLMMMHLILSFILSAKGEEA